MQLRGLHDCMARAPHGDRGSGCWAGSSPKKWLTQRLRSAAGIWQMVRHRCRMDRGRPADSLAPVSWLSYLTPLSRIFATCEGSPPKRWGRACRAGGVRFAALGKRHQERACGPAASALGNLPQMLPGGKRDASGSWDQLHRELACVATGGGPRGVGVGGESKHCAGCETHLQ